MNSHAFLNGWFTCEVLVPRKLTWTWSDQLEGVYAKLESSAGYNPPLEGLPIHIVDRRQKTLETYRKDRPSIYKVITNKADAWISQEKSRLLVTLKEKDIGRRTEHLLSFSYLLAAKDGPLHWKEDSAHAKWFCIDQPGPRFRRYFMCAITDSSHRLIHISNTAKLHIGMHVRGQSYMPEP